MLENGTISVAEMRRQEEPVSLMVPGVSASIRVLQQVITEIAPTNIPILILGESGSGKEIIASEIHRLSPQSEGPFIKFNCSCMTLNWLLDLEIQRRGNGSQQNGTVLLDEVGQLDLAKQTLLLNLFPDRERGVSGSCLTSRLISTSIRDLAQEMRDGSFREELYFRLNGICLRIPALRQRREDIPALFAAFISKHSNLLARQQPRIKNSTMDLLLQHSWPGNVRELENVARKVVVLGNDELAISDLAVNSGEKLPANTASNGTNTKARSLKQAAREASREAERHMILESLERTHWNRKQSARELQVSYKALLYKLKQLELETEKKTMAKRSFPTA